MPGYAPATEAAPWRVPLRPYLRAFPFGADRNLDALEDAIALMPAGRAVPHPARPDLAFSVHRRLSHETILVDDALTGERVGGAIDGVPLVLPHWRGEGVGAEIFCFSDLQGGFGLRPMPYSESGFLARIGAHRRHLERALRWCPGDVPADALRDYRRLPGGGLRLASPWSRSRHEVWMLSLARR